MEIGIASARSILDRLTTYADDYYRTNGPFEVDMADLHALMKEFQCAKWVVNRRAIEIVDQAMTLSGGAGYLAFSPLARLYRDVRAGPFMQPYSPNEAFEYIGKVALGIDP